MAHDFWGVADIATINNRNLADIDGITDLLQDAPVLARMNATTASNGKKHQYKVRNGAPVVTFRNVNQGKEHSKGSYRIVEADLEYLDPSTQVDVAEAALWKGGSAAFVADNNMDHLREGFATTERQFFYGEGGADANDATGFKGLADAFGTLANSNVLDGGGAGASLSSVWAIRTTPDHKNCSVVLGNEGNITVSNPVKQQVKEEGSEKTYWAWCTEIGAWISVAVGSKWSVFRLANVANLNDNMLGAMFSKMKGGKPTFLAMTMDVQEQLRQSRTATNERGAPAPTPMDFQGVDIVTTNQLRDDETAVA